MLQSSEEHGGSGELAIDLVASGSACWTEEEEEENPDALPDHGRDSRDCSLSRRDSRRTSR